MEKHCLLAFIWIQDPFAKGAREEAAMNYQDYLNQAALQEFCCDRREALLKEAEEERLLAAGRVVKNRRVQVHNLLQAVQAVAALVVGVLER